MRAWTFDPAEVALKHYSDRELESLRDVSQGSREHHHHPWKPSGLWVCPGEQWAEWTREQSFERGDLAYEIRLSDGARILDVATPADLDALPAGRSAGGVPAPDWEAVAREFDGVRVEYHALRPFALLRPMRHLWVTTLDVDCVCIWRPSRAVASFRLLT